MVNGGSILGGIHLVRPGERKTAGKKRTEGLMGSGSGSSEPRARSKRRAHQQALPSGEFPFQVAGRLPFRLHNSLPSLPRTTSLLSQRWLSHSQASSLSLPVAASLLVI